MYSASSVGTHHIFFSPRLEIVPFEELTDRFSAYLPHDAPFLRLLGYEANSPSTSSIGTIAAHHGDDGRFLTVIQQPLRCRASFFTQGHMQATGEVPPTNAPDLPRVSSYSSTRAGKVETFVEQFQYANSAPNALFEGPSSQQRDVIAVKVTQRQTGKRCRFLFHGLAIDHETRATATLIKLLRSEH